MNQTDSESLHQSERCPVCGGKAGLAFSVNAFSIFACNQCGHQFVAEEPATNHVEHVYGDDYFFGGGEGYPDYFREAEIVSMHAKQYVRIVRQNMRPGRLLDVGCAAGFILREFVREGWQGTGIEPNKTMADYGRQNLSLDVITGTIEDCPLDEQFNLTTLIQVAGHFHDLNAAFENIRSATVTGGLCLIEYWNRKSTIARLMGKRWQEYSPPSVLHWFGDDDLDLLLQKHGFELTARGRPRKLISGQHLQSFIHHKLSSNAVGRVAAYPLKLIPSAAKLRYPPMDLKWALYRKRSNES